VKSNILDIGHAPISQIGKNSQQIRQRKIKSKQKKNNVRRNLKKI
jgi:hypothetical protein